MASARKSESGRARKGPPAPRLDAAAIALGTRPLGIDAVVRVARGLAPVALDGAARGRLAAARAVVERFAAGDAPVYGLTTGLGAGVDTRLAPAGMAAFQAQAIRARSVGVGARMATDEVRAMLLARLAGFAAGRSGVSPHVADALAALLNARVHPLVPTIGSIGAADLAPLAHCGLVLLGDGLAEHDGEILDGAAALAAAGLKPVVLGPKDGIALLNCNAASIGPGALALADARQALDALDVAASLSFEGFRANVSPLDPRLQALRPAPGQPDTAARLTVLLAGSLLWKPGAARRVQDPLSFRCVAPVHGAAHAALDAAITLVGIELNGAGDNPLVLAEDDEILSGPNFDVTALALAFETLGQALGQTASLAVGRIVKLMSPSFNDLPRFLTPGGKTSTGFATTQKTAAALEAEIRHLAMPVSLHVASVADGVEDYATMAPRVVAKTREIVDRLRLLTALELIVAAQAVDLRKLAKIGKGAAAAHAAVRSACAFLDDDRPLGPDIETVAALIAAGKVAPA
jgi:histidine ammonia-lyase